MLWKGRTRERISSAVGTVLPWRGNLIARVTVPQRSETAVDGRDRSGVILQRLAGWQLDGSWRRQGEAGLGFSVWGWCHGASVTPVCVTRWTGVDGVLAMGHSHSVGTDTFPGWEALLERANLGGAALMLWLH